MHRLSARSATALALTGVAVLAAGCGSSSSTPAAGASASASAGASAGSSAGTALSGTITVFAASSLTKVFTALGTQFEAAHPGTTVKFSFGASSTLAQQIIAGAPADVFASASTKSMTQVTAAGDASGPKDFATNLAEIAVAPDSASKVTSLADLAKPGIKVALCQAQVPCGELATKVLSNAKITVKPVTQGLDVKSTLAYVTGGQVDAAIVYVTDVKAAGSTVKGVLIPAAENSTTSYPIATVKGTKNAALAAAFDELVLGTAGQSALSEAGFLKP